ncbi:MAG TPA: hypothetical protein VJA19_05205 [Pseudomonas sp.]|nr:hypothetical protein [Pseudomonas sp.]
MKNLVLAVSVVCAVIGLAGCSSMAQDGTMVGAHEAFEESNFAACLSRTAEAEYYGSQSRAMDAKIMFYRAVCLEGLGQVVASKGIFEKLVRLYPETDWAIVARSKFLNGVSVDNSY